MRETNKTKNIMLVDDDNLLREVIEETLTAEGYKVISFPDGFKAIEEYKISYMETDLILLDMMMPGLSGLEVVKEMKIINPDVKVIIMSGYLDKNILRYISQNNIIEFIHKPISLLQLIYIIEKAT